MVACRSSRSHHRPPGSGAGSPPGADGSWARASSRCTPHTPSPNGPFPTRAAPSAAERATSRLPSATGACSAARSAPARSRGGHPLGRATQSSSAVTAPPAVRRRTTRSAGWESTARSAARRHPRSPPRCSRTPTGRWSSATGTSTRITRSAATRAASSPASSGIGGVAHPHAVGIAAQPGQPAAHGRLPPVVVPHRRPRQLAQGRAHHVRDRHRPERDLDHRARMGA